MDTISKISAAVALMQNYNWYGVNVFHAKKKPVHCCNYMESIDCYFFGATGIRVMFDRCLQIERNLSTPIYTNAFIDAEMVAPDMAKFKMEDGTIYQLQGFMENFANPETATGTIKDFAISTLIDYDRSMMDAAGNVRVVLDLNKAGILDKHEYALLMRNLTNLLDAHKAKYQWCRTVYFSRNQNNPNNVNIGLYNLESDSPMNCKEWLVDIMPQSSRDRLYGREIDAVFNAYLDHIKTA